MKKLLIAFAGLSLVACQPGGGSVFAAPAPLSHTSADEKGLVLSLEVFDTLLTSIDRLVAAGVIIPGSPRALQLANAIHTAKVAYQAASAAQRAGNSGSYFTAIGQAQLAVAQINVLVKGN